MSTTERTVEVAATAASLYLSGKFCILSLRTGLLTLLCAGVISSISTIAVPAALSTSIPTDALLQQWKSIYDRGSKQNAAIAALAAFAHGSIAYLRWKRGGGSTSNVLAAVFTIGIVPYTYAVMLPTNKQLFSASSKGDKKEDVRNVVARWGWLNGVRALLPMIGGLASLVGIAR